MTPIDIYIAAPYSYDDPKVHLYRFEQVTKYAAQLVLQGHIVYSPITHSHPMFQLNPFLVGDWSFWKRFDEAYIQSCASLHVLMLEGWELSVGVQAEIITFQEQNKPITYIEWSNEN
jgi:hypothetical protein